MKLSLSILSGVALVAAMTLALAGGAAPVQADPPANPFAGSWTGTFQAVEGDATGTLEWTITAAGKLTGSFLNTVANVGGTMVGHIGSDGTLNLNPNIYGPGPGGKGQNGEHHAGTAFLNEDGQLVAPTTGVWHGGYSVVAILTKN